GRQTIDEEIAAGVVDLLRYQLAVRRESDPVDADNAIAKLEEKIRRALARGPVAMRDLQRRCHYNRVGLWAWRTAFGNLLMAGEVEHDKALNLVRLTAHVEPVTTSVTTSKNGFFSNANAD